MISMNDYAPFNKKSTAYFQRSLTNWLSVAEGGKRAGKNILNIICFCQCLEEHPDKIHLAAGVTKATARMNIIDSNGFGLMNYFYGRCRSGTYNGVDCLYISTKTGQKIVLIAGGKDSDSYRAIKGFSLGSVYITEANECHKTFIQECFDRTIASRQRKLLMDINPKSPRHWFYTDILDYQDKVGGYNYGHFTLFDNMSLTDEVLDEVLATYDKSSLWYRADILGQRTAASGLVYTAWDKDNVISTAELAELSRRERFKRFSIGVDIGGTDATVATLVGHTLKEIILIDGYYHKQGKRTGKTHAQYAMEIVQSIEQWVDVYPKVAAAVLYCESADKLFRQALIQELKKRGFWQIQVIPSYKKDGIVDRIRLCNILIHQKRLKVCSELKMWLEAFENAVWSDDEFEKGNWVRVDDGSYPVDCLDSTEYAIQPYKQELLEVYNL